MLREISAEIIGVVRSYFLSVHRHMRSDMIANLCHSSDRRIGDVYACVHSYRTVGRALEIRKTGLRTSAIKYMTIWCPIRRVW